MNSRDVALSAFDPVVDAIHVQPLPMSCSRLSICSRNSLR